MPVGFGYYWGLDHVAVREPVKIGRPHRDRARVKAGRKSARRTRRR